MILSLQASYHFSVSQVSFFFVLLSDEDKFVIVMDGWKQFPVWYTVWCNTHVILHPKLPKKHKRSGESV